MKLPGRYAPLYCSLYFIPLLPNNQAEFPLLSMFTKIQLSSGAFLCYNDLQRAVASGVTAGASPLPYNIEEETTMKRLNINKYYRYCSYSLDAQEANQQHYWFDMKHFKMIDHRGPCDMYDDNPDIIPFPHFIPESRYKDLMRALNNPQVTEFFNAAKDKEDVYFRYRVFIDQNGLSFTEQYRLNQDKAITLMKWCNDHDIPYIYRSEARGTYLQYDYDDLEGEIWQIPDM